MKVTKYRIIKKDSVYYPQVKRLFLWEDLPHKAIGLGIGCNIFICHHTYESAFEHIKEHYTSTMNDVIVSTRECDAKETKIMIVSSNKTLNNYQAYIRFFLGTWKNIDNNGGIVDEYIHKSCEEAISAAKKYLDLHFDMRIEISGFNEIKNHPYVIEHGFPLTTK